MAQLPKKTDKVPCPHCGGLFKARGLATHLRLKHPEESSAPAAATAADGESGTGEADGSAVPRRGLRGTRRSSQAPASTSDHVAEDLLREVRDALMSVEARLLALEAAQLLGGAGGGPGRVRTSVLEVSGEEKDRLRAELAQLVDEIEVLRVESKARSGRIDAGTERGEDVENERRARRTMGELRQRQLMLLMRLGEDAPGAPSGWGVGGFGLI